MWGVTGYTSVSCKCNSVTSNRKIPRGAYQHSAWATLNPRYLASFSVTFLCWSQGWWLDSANASFSCFSESLGETTHFRGNVLVWVWIWTLWDEVGWHSPVLLWGTLQRGGAVPEGVLRTLSSGPTGLHQHYQACLVACVNCYDKSYCLNPRIKYVCVYMCF